MVGKIIKALLFLLIVVASAAAYYTLRVSETVTVGYPVRGPAVQAVYATGTVEPSVMLPVAARSAARLMALLADEGQTVTKGQVLAQLEDEDLQKTLAELQAKADLAQKEYDRKAALVTKGAASKQSVDLAQSDLDAAHAAVERAQANIGYMKLTAPEDGTVIKRDGEIGQLIPASQPVFWLSCCAGLRITAEVDEEDIPLVKEGQKTVIRADAFPGQVFDGTVQSITPKGDPISRSYRVRISLPADTSLHIGMTAEANIVIREEQNALLLPAGAVKDGTVRVDRNGAPILQKVNTGARSAETVEITEGLDEKSLVVLDASRVEKEGGSIRTSIQNWRP